MTILEILVSKRSRIEKSSKDVTKKWNKLKESKCCWRTKGKVTQMTEERRKKKERKEEKRREKKKNSFVPTSR